MTLHVNYCVTVLLLNCVRATVSAIRPNRPSVCLLGAYIDLFPLLYLAAGK